MTLEKLINQYENSELLNSKCFLLVEKLLENKKELEKDKIRIDWLADPSNRIGNVQLPIECAHNNLGSLRGAIDQAMTMQKSLTEDSQ